MPGPVAPGLAGRWRTGKGRHHPGEVPAPRGMCFIRGRHSASLSIACCTTSPAGYFLEDGLQQLRRPGGLVLPQLTQRSEVKGRRRPAHRGWTSAKRFIRSTPPARLPVRSDSRPELNSAHGWMASAGASVDAGWEERVRRRSAPSRARSPGSAVERRGPPGRGLSFTTGEGRDLRAHRRARGDRRGQGWRDAAARPQRHHADRRPLGFQRPPRREESRRFSSWSCFTEATQGAHLGLARPHPRGAAGPTQGRAGRRRGTGRTWGGGGSQPTEDRGAFQEGQERRPGATKARCRPVLPLSRRCEKNAPSSQAVHPGTSSIAPSDMPVARRVRRTAGAGRGGAWGLRRSPPRC